MNEEWKPIDGFPGYEVSNLGRVKSVRRLYRRSDTIMEGAIWNGYIKVSLTDKPYHFVQKYVHILVLEAFVGPKPEGAHAHHKNGKRNENSLDNLEWLHRETHHKLHGLGYLSDETCDSIRSSYEAGGITQRELAKKYGVSQSTINYVLNRRKP